MKKILIGNLIYCACNFVFFGVVFLAIYILEPFSEPPAHKNAEQEVAELR